LVRNGDRHELIEVGYVVLRRFFDHHPLVAELDRALKDGTSALQPPQLFSVGGDTFSLRYLPMMCERTPQSLDLACTLAPVAEELLGRGALPGRAKGTEYSSDTSWHRDSEHDIQSVGCLAYLDRLTAASGALRVLPRSHQDRTRILPDDAGDAGLVIETDPGDVIVFDEHLVHGSRGGRERRQWRVDFVVDPSPVEVPAVRQWFAQSLPDERGDVGYDARRYPSYGAHWRSLYPRWAARLVALGVLAQRTPGNGRASHPSRYPDGISPSGGDEGGWPPPDGLR
jgi:hypothetical protein